MKTTFYLALLILFPFISFSQFTSDFVIYNPNNEQFYLVIGNSTVNNYSTNKVLVSDLQAGTYSVTVNFQSTGIQSVYSNIYIPSNTLVSAILKKNNYGNYYIEIVDAVIYNQGNYNPPIHDDNVSPQGHYCNYPMTPDIFASAKQTIINESFDSKKLTIAKQILNSNCVTSMQVKELTMLFDFESNKLEFAKFAYKHTFDPQNYFLVNDAFEFSSSKSSLSDYIDSLNE
jgi:hypothetical protein